MSCRLIKEISVDFRGMDLDFCHTDRVRASNNDGGTLTDGCDEKENISKVVNC